MYDYSTIEKNHLREIEIRKFVSSQPTASFWLRLPLIRHVRAAIEKRRMERHYAFWYAYGSLPLYKDFDEAVIDAIWRGEK